MKITANSTLADFIMVLDDAVAPSLGRRVLDEYADASEWVAATVDDNQAASGVRTCDLLDMSDPDVIGSSDERSQLLLDATSAAAGWAKMYENAVTTIGLSGRTGLGLARYRVGAFYRAHQDNHPSEQRTVTLIAALPSPFSGGELSFFRGDHVVALQPGQVCMFPATFQYTHSVEPVLGGTRYAMLTWLN